jgi:hypothetical protein
VLLRGHLVSASVVTAAAAATAVFFAVARPTYHRAVTPPPPPPDHGLPYHALSYTAADARRAFAAVGIELTPRSHSASVTTQGDRGDVLEVDAFGKRELVERSGFYDYTSVDGRYVHFPPACGRGARAAERWRGFGNVLEQAHALLGAGRCLLAAGDAGADASLTEAARLLRAMGAGPALHETELLLARAQATPA